jgi:hypothetical protein
MVKKIIAKYYLCNCGECYATQRELGRHIDFNNAHNVEKVIYLCSYETKAPKEDENRRSKTLIYHDLEE